MKRVLGPGLVILVGAFLIRCGGSGGEDAVLNGGSTGDGGAGATGADGSAASGQGTGGSTIIGAGAGSVGSSTGGSVGIGGTSGGTGTGGASSGTGGGPVTMVTPVDPGSACASQTTQAQAGDLDMFIMQDRSFSMSQTTANGDSKWKVITDAVTSFVNDPQSAGIGAGIGFFGVPVTNGAGGAGGGGGRRGGGGFVASSCDPAVYATPDVAIAPLNGNAGAIAAAINGKTPATDTPTEPALQGALDYARAWAGQHPTHKTIVVFSTDGLPNGCNSSVQGASGIAAAGVSGTPSIPTYVIGVFGSKDCPNGLNQQCNVVNNTNAIAKGGGTGTAFIVDTGGNTEGQFLSAMNAIRTANKVGCQYSVPPSPSGQTIDLSRASVRYTPSGGTARDLTWVSSATGCNASSGGWYYDNVANPGQMLLCPATCTAVQADPMARLDILLACVPPGTGTGAGGQPGTGGAPGSGGAPGTGGASGTGGAPGTGGSAGHPSCLLNGQSCQTGGECCSGSCAGVCTQIN